MSGKKTLKEVLGSAKECAKEKSDTLVAIGTELEEDGDALKVEVESLAEEGCEFAIEHLI